MQNDAFYNIYYNLSDNRKLVAKIKVTQSLHTSCYTT